MVVNFDIQWLLKADGLVIPREKNSLVRYHRKNFYIFDQTGTLFSLRRGFMFLECLSKNIQVYPFKKKLNLGSKFLPSVSKQSSQQAMFIRLCNQFFSYQRFSTLDHFNSKVSFKSKKFKTKGDKKPFSLFSKRKNINTQFKKNYSYHPLWIYSNNPGVTDRLRRVFSDKSPVWVVPFWIPGLVSNYQQVISHFFNVQKTSIDFPQTILFLGDVIDEPLYSAIRETTIKGVPSLYTANGTSVIRFFGFPFLINHLSLRTSGWLGIFCSHILFKKNFLLEFIIV